MDIKRIIREEVDWFEHHESDFSGTVINFNPPLPAEDYTKLIPMLKEMGVTHWINSEESSIDNNYPIKYSEELSILVVREDNQLVWDMSSFEHWRLSDSNKGYLGYTLVDGYEFFDVVLDESLNESEGFKDSNEEDFEWVKEIKPTLEEELNYKLKGTPYTVTVTGARYKVGSGEGSYYIDKSTEIGYTVRIFYNDVFKYVFTLSNPTVRSFKFVLKKTISSLTTKVFREPNEYWEDMIRKYKEFLELI